ncbi:MAG: hypothetical protein FD152_1520, partial [Xanthobacteraceae bacterium]
GEPDVHVAVHPVVGGPERCDRRVLARSGPGGCTAVLVSWRRNGGWALLALRRCGLTMVALAVMAVTMLLGGCHGSGGEKQGAGKSGSKDTGCHDDSLHGMSPDRA